MAFDSIDDRFSCVCGRVWHSGLEILGGVQDDVREYSMTFDLCIICQSYGLMARITTGL